MMTKKRTLATKRPLTMTLATLKVAEMAQGLRDQQLGRRASQHSCRKNCPVSQSTGSLR